MSFSLKNGQLTAEQIIDYLGLTTFFQQVADTNNAVKDINNGKTNLNQKGLDGYAAILANAAVANAGLNTFLMGFNKLPNTPATTSAKAYLTVHSFSFNLGIATTSVPLAAALYKEGRYSDAVSTLLSGGSAALGAINDAQSLNPKVTPTELKTNLAQLLLAGAAMLESEYKFTDQAIDALSHLIEDMDNALKDMWQSFKDFDGNQKWNDFLDNFADWFLPKTKKLNDWYGDFEDWIGNQFDWLSDKFSDWFDGLNRDGNYFLYDPLVLDLDGDGVELIAENDWNGVLFDFNGNGIKTATQWLNGDDGLLVFDRNDNGKIDNGSELFGEDTPIRFITDPVYDGFSALQTIDTHPDFEINAKDDNWQYLKVWRDLNQDGEVQDGELFGLDELGITALSLTAKNGVSTYTKADGTNGKLADVNFNIDTIHSEYIEHINLSEEYLQLPNLHGVGMLRDLREASSISEELKWIVQLYQNANTKEEQLNLLDSLMQEWAKTDPHFNGKGIIFDATFTVVPNNQSHFGITPSQQKQGAMLVDVEAMNNYVNAIKYAPIVDSFLGTETKKVYYFGTKMAEQSIKIIIETYEKISQHLYQALLMQTRLKPYADEIELVFNNDELIFDFDKVEELFSQVYQTNSQKAFIDLAEFIVYGNMGSNWNGGYALLSNWANELNLSGSLNNYLELLGNDVIDALTTQNGTDADDFLTAISLLNRATLNGHDGKDTLIAGSSYNILNGGEDTDLYVFDGDFAAA